MLKKTITEKTFTLPEKLDPAYDPKKPQEWTVKAFASGGVRQLEELLLRGQLISDRSVRLYQAFLSFGGTTFCWEDGTAFLKKNPTLQEFTEAWDMLPEEIIEWIVTCIEEVNPQYRPLQETQAKS